MPMMQLVRRASVATSLLALAACNFFDVSNPGPIPDEELDQMRDLVREAMDAGAIGVSTALIYPPAVYASTRGCRVRF